MIRLAIYVAAATIVATGASHAAPFSPDTAKASSEFSSGYVADNTIDGTGMTAGFGPGDTHATYAFGNHWTTGPNTDPLAQWIEWGFATPTDIGGLWIWNHLSNGIASNAFYEPTEFSLTFRDDADNVLDSFAGIALAPQPAATDPAFGTSQAFTLSAPIANVSAVRFDVDGKEPPLAPVSTAYTGLAEVLFTGDTITGATVIDGGTPPAIPLPAAGWLLIGGLAGVAALRKKAV